MDAITLAREFLRIFYGDGDLEELNSILAEDLEFSGPFIQTKTAEAYMAALRKSPPQEMDYDILYEFESNCSACVIYRFSKPGVDVSMAQIFEAIDGKISKIILIFDSSKF